MSTIGTFTTSEDGFIGTIRTLTLNVKVRIVPNPTKTSDYSPDFRLMASTGLEVGAAWRKVSKASDRPYLSVTLDDVSFASAIFARLVESDDGRHHLIWSRMRGD